MSSITYRFEQTRSVLNKVILVNDFSDTTRNLDELILNLDSHVNSQWHHFNPHIKTLYLFEKEIDIWCNQANISELKKNHIQNITLVEQSVRYNPLAPLDWTFVFNPNTSILRTNIDSDNLLSAIESGGDLETESNFPFFVRPYMLQSGAYFALKLADWNLLLLDLFECDMSFTGRNIYELLLASNSFESEHHLQQQVVEFLRIQLIYLNSLTIIES